MKNRFGRMGSTLMGALLLLSVSGVTYSCKDDSLDTQKPSFLGGSIYDELNARGFKYTVRLIEDLGYKAFCGERQSLRGIFQEQSLGSWFV